MGTRRRSIEERRMIGDLTYVAVGCKVLAPYDGVHYTATVNRLPQNEGIGLQ